MNSKIAMREIAAQRFRFWIMGRITGAATVRRVRMPRRAVVRVAMRR